MPKLQSDRAYSKHKQVIIIIALALFTFAASIISIMIGRYPISLNELKQVVSSLMRGQIGFGPVWGVILDMRLPRIIGALFVGSSMAMAGAAFQGVFKNPMVSPDLLGASAGASCGAALAILMSFPTALIPVPAFLGGLVSVFFAYMLSVFLDTSRRSTLILILSGMVVANLFSAGISLIKFVADPNSKLPEITFWLMGGLAGVTMREVAILIVPVAIGIVLLFLFRWKLNIMTLGDEEAESLGVNTRRIRFIVILGATLMTSASVAVSGMVGWVGLIVPHLARRLVGPDYRVLLPVSLLMGASFLLIVDDVARCVYTTEIPISILTAVIGVPLFVMLLRKQRGSE